MGIKPSKPTPTPYPYDTPLVKTQIIDDLVRKKIIPSHDPNQIDPVRALEFLRIEALLRSQTLFALYKKAKADLKRRQRKGERGRLSEYTHELEKKYNIKSGWGILKGWHHYDYFTPEPFEWIVGRGIADLSIFAREMTNTGGYTIETLLTSPAPRCLYLAIDKTIPPKILLKEIKRILERPPDILPPPKVRLFPTHMFAYENTQNQDVMGLNLKAWLDYRDWYDMHYCEGKSLNEIAEHESRARDSTTRGQVNTGIRRFRKLIECAETNQWPPPKGTLP